MVFDAGLSISRACLDHTTLYKSCIKTIKARSKATGEALPSSRIFPNAANGLTTSTEKNTSKKKTLATAHFFQRAREIEDNISRHKQLLHDHRRRYMGQMNDPLSMSQEECLYMDKIIANNLKTVEQQITSLESNVPPSLLQKLKKATHCISRPGDDNTSNPLRTAGQQSGSDGSSYTDVECCMTITTLVIRASLAELNTTFGNLKEAKTRKQSVKAKLMRLHRPACVEKSSTIRLRQLQQAEQARPEPKHDEPVATDCRKKVQFEDWRDDEEAYFPSTKSDKNSTSTSNNVLPQPSPSTLETSDTTSISSNYFPNPDGTSSLHLNKRSELVSAEDSSPRTRHTSSSNDHTSGNHLPTRSSHHNNTSTTSYREHDTEDATTSDEDHQMLEQENAQLYSELQSTQEEVRQITRQVAELGRLQDVLLESVQDQAVVADTVQHQVVAATDNVQEGNEQIREAMRKDASFRVWIMFFLIVMSFTILFLDWYNV